MESPLKKYKQLQNIDNIKKLAYDNIFSKYIIENLTGKDKMWEIESTDQEGLMKKMNGGYPIPGFIYTFIYAPKKDDKIKVIERGQEKEYVDYVPVVFCTSIDKIKSFKGINLNVLPNIERVKFFESYYQSYKSFFKDIENLTQNNKLALNNKFISAMTSPRNQNVIQIFNKKASANFSYGYRTYDMKRIDQFRMIEYTEWDYIPFYDPIHAFKLMNQKQIHDIYYRSLGNI